MVEVLLLRIFGVLLVVSSILGDNLSARRLNTRFPFAMKGMSPYYDGKSDFIYLFGGSTGGWFHDSILRFDISTESIVQIGTLEYPSVESTLVADSNGNPVYFDNINYPFKVYKFDIADNSVKTVGRPNGTLFNTTSVKNSAGKALLLGGWLQNNIWEYDIDSDNVQGEVAGVMPVTFSSAAAIKVADNTALLFGSDGVVPYLELDLETMETKEVAVNSFPGFQYGMRATTDNKFVYIFGGNFTSFGIPVDGIIKLDTITHSWDFLQIDNFPVRPDSYLASAPEVIWVEKLNRIYMFGGGLQRGAQETFLDSIYIIELNPTSPTTLSPTSTTTEVPTSTTLDPAIFTCDDRSDGTHPHPSDCSKYIACINGTLEGVHPCPPPLLYDPATRNCNLPSLVDCQLSCENKEDGTYPHPHQCSLFIICSNRELFVFWCDPPLLFDPKELRCTLADLVQCENA